MALLKHIHILPRATMIQLVVWSANGDGNAFPRRVPRSICDGYVRVILQKRRARCTLNKENFDLLNEESVSGVCSGRANLRREVYGSA